MSDCGMQVKSLIDSIECTITSRCATAEIYTYYKSCDDDKEKWRQQEESLEKIKYKS